MRDILVVDDNKSWRDYIRYLFTEYAIYEAESGEEGIDMYKQLAQKEDCPPIVLMDVMLNGINGFEAAKSIKEIDPEAKIVIMSFYPEVHEGKGDFEFIQKDRFNSDAVFEVLNQEVMCVSKNVQGNLLIKKIEGIITNATV